MEKNYNKKNKLKVVETFKEQEMERKKIVFNVVNIKNWMGGVYYAQNIINLIMHSERLQQKYEVHVLTSSAHAHVFEKFGESIKLVEMDYENYYLNSLYFIKYMRKNKIDYWYALSMNIVEKLLVKKAILWIADFQYIHLPQYFSGIEWKTRNATSKYMAKQNNVLVLSSEDARRDFVENYKKNKSNCYVVHFTSAIEEEVRKITKDKEDQILQKYGLYGKIYIYIPNQFWQHKNHLVVLRMIEKFIKNNKDEVLFVFTGQMHDYRSKEYTEKLRKYFEQEDIDERTVNLGFLDREEQLIIMKNACFLIQPSLFEGWGTVLEDAKVLDKRVILSDLEVHKEQQYEKCTLFQRDNPNDLLDKVNRFLKDDVKDDLEAGIERFHKDSRNYAKELERILL